MNKPNIAIIGAGPAGLSTAYFLVEENLLPTIFEAGDVIGGLAGSIYLWDKKYDIGPHIFLESCAKEAVNLWKELGGSDMQHIELSRGMILNRRLSNFPPEAFGLLKSLGIRRTFLAGLDLILSKSKKTLPAKNAGEFFRQKFGEKFRSQVFGPFCEKYIGLPDDQVDIGFATGLVSFARDTEDPNKLPDKKKIKTLLYPKQGTHLIWSRMADKINKRSEIEFGKRLQKVITEGKRIKTLQFTDGSTVSPDFVVSSLPIVGFLKLLDHCPDHILALTSEISSRSTILVYLKLNKKSFTQQYITVFDHSLEVGRISNFNSWQKNPTDDTVLCLEYWCKQTDEIWKQNDDSIISKAVEEMELIKLLIKDNVVDSKVVRIPHSHPVLSTNHNKSLQTINHFLAQFENLILSGRHATFKWDGQADNITSGASNAKKIKEILK